MKAISPAAPASSSCGEIVAHWQSRIEGKLRIVDGFGEDVAIVTDPGLRQIIGNVIDNAQEGSAGLISNISEAACRLGLHRRTLARKLEKRRL